MISTYALIEHTVVGDRPPPHIHTAEEETFYVLEDELNLLVGDRTVTATAGAFVLVPGGTVSHLLESRDGIGHDIGYHFASGLREVLCKLAAELVIARFSSANILRNCAVVWEITIFRGQASQSGPRDVLPRLGRQGQRLDRVIRQKVLPSAAQRQVPPAISDPARPAHLPAASKPHQKPFGVALSSQPL